MLIATSSVPVTITDGPAEPEVKTLPRHKKNPEVGEKQTVYSSTILLEQEDAASFEDQEEVGRSRLHDPWSVPKLCDSARSPSWTGATPSCAQKLLDLLVK
jgi:hypothetical protein